jgi:hypothetical protein
MQSVHLVVDRICGRPVNSSAALQPQQPAAQAKVSSSSGGAAAAAAAAALCDDAVRSALAQATSGGWSSADLSGAAERANITDAVSEILSSVYAARRIELSAAYARAAVTLAPQHLRDFDWSVRLVLASDKIASMRDARMMLSLDVSSASSAASPAATTASTSESSSSIGSGSSTSTDSSTVHVELNKQELDALIASCTAVQKVVRSLQV